MDYKIVTLEKKTFVGLMTRAGNNDPEMPKIVGGLWNDFMCKNVAEKINNKANPYCIGLYSDYDFKDMSYDVTIGVEVTKSTNKELCTKTIPAGKYAKFSIKGDVVKDVADAWTEIWSMKLDRTFTGDYEEYISNVNNIAEVNIYVALK